MLCVLSSERAGALHSEAMQAGEPFRFNVLDQYGDVSVVARSDDEQSWRDLRDRVHINIRRPTWSVILRKIIARVREAAFRHNSPALRRRLAVFALGVFVAFVVLPSWHRLRIGESVHLSIS